MAFASIVASSARFQCSNMQKRSLVSAFCGQRRVDLREFSQLRNRRSMFEPAPNTRFALSSRSYTKPSTDSTFVAVPENTAVIPTETASSVAEGLSGTEVAAPDLMEKLITHIPPALQYGDLAALGLVGWTPAGLIRWSLELINVSTGLPWFYTIVLGSAFWKLILLPLSVKGLQNSARLLPLQGKITASQEEMNRIRMSGDKLALQKHALKMRKMYKDAGVNMGLTALAPFVQIPITLGMFFGVKKLCELPLPQLAYSGLDILPDLTVADPYMILPVALCAAINLQISVGANELNMKERPETGHIMNGLRLLSLVGVWVMSTFPSGLMVSLLTTSVVTTAQSLAFQAPSIRRLLNIQAVPKEVRGKLPSMKATFDFVKQKMTNNLAQAKQKQKQKN